MEFKDSKKGMMVEGGRRRKAGWKESGEMDGKSKMGEEGGKSVGNAEGEQMIDDGWCHQVGVCVCV